MPLTGKELYEELKSRGMLDYGSTIPKALVHRLCGIEVPEYGKRSDFSRIGLDELAIITPTKDLLLKEGKYLQIKDDVFRIFHASENAAQIEKYHREAKNKTNRAYLLQQSTPPLDGDAIRKNNHNMNSIHALEHSRKQQEERAAVGTPKKRRKKRQKPGSSPGALAIGV